MTRWRRQRVRRAMIKTELPFTNIREQNGYRSRTACSQAFRRMFSHPQRNLRNYVKPRLGDRYKDEVIGAAA